MGADVAGSWDAEYATGKRYTADEPPVGFVGDVLAVAKENDVASGLYIGAGNGRNFIPLSDAGLELLGLDISSVAISQLAERAPRFANRLVVGDLTALPEGQRWPLVVALQVIQHGTRGEVHQFLGESLERVESGGLFAIRVNAVGTDVRHAHEVVERGADGAFSVRYTAGPKNGLTVHFWAAAELDRAIRGVGLTPLLRLRPASTWRDPAELGLWLQWEGIYRKE
jgi:predicted TPR repeat methyltransferase